jgi:hypothetical protein
MSETKFTSDGKKVVIVGKLNAQETIVQEIFIQSNGAEIPSGENFVVKSLHDAPVISWKEKRVKEIEAEYDNSQKERGKLEGEMNLYRERHHVELKKIRAHMQYAAAALKNVSESSFEMIVTFLEGGYTHVVEYDYYGPKIVSMSEFHELCDDKLQLIGLFGKDDGTLRFARHEYSDGSGRKIDFTPCKSMNEALETAKNMVLAMKIGDYKIAKAAEFGIELGANEIGEYKKERLEIFSKSIQKAKDEIAKLEARRKEIESMK